ncbi:retrotransposon protein, putative, ty1-copia subclass [Tanacetum coccineum]
MAGGMECNIYAFNEVVNPKAKKKSLKAKGKGKANGKGNDKQVYIPKPKNPKPSAKEHPAKDDTCHHCKEVGHWKRNFPVYLAELLKKKKQVGIASSSALIEPNIIWTLLIYGTAGLAHISKKRIEKLQQEGLLKSTNDESFDQCVSCLSGKMTRKSFPHRPERATDLLGIIHTDVCGPLRHVSRQGASYFITSTDDYSRYGYVYLLKHKHELSPPYTPQHNGVSERRNCTSLDMVRSMMNLTTLALSFWDYALESTTRILNMVPTKKVNKTPYELWRSGLEKLQAKYKRRNVPATEAESNSSSVAVMKAVMDRKFILGLGAKHYHMRYHYVRESIALGEIRFLKVHTDDNLADPFTKALSKGKLTQHARSMRLRLDSSFMKEKGTNEATWRKFSLKELHAATNNFNYDNKLGEGGFGSCYWGQLWDRSQIAVKRLKVWRNKAEMEFAVEVEILARVRHKNLLSLRGYCAEGSAEGIAYLHHHVTPHIIHGDIKASNILLDSDFKAQVADFGFAKLIPEGATHATTQGKGTLGYLAPEYSVLGKASESCDVYSFGILLLELIHPSPSRDRPWPRKGKEACSNSWEERSHTSATVPVVVDEVPKQKELKCNQGGISKREHRPVRLADIQKAKIVKGVTESPNQEDIGFGSTSYQKSRLIAMKDLRTAFRENYLQQTKHIKDPVEIHHIKQRDGESTKTHEDTRQKSWTWQDTECMKSLG